MKTAEKLITAERLESLIAQLKSSEEDRILTLNIIDNYNVDDNLVFFMLLKKRSNTSWALWKEHAPTATERLHFFISEESNLTYQYMIEMAAKNQVDIAQLQYFMDDFGSHLQTVLKSYGYDFIKKVTITLTENLNPND